MDGCVKRKKCYIYTRVSTVAQTEGFSLDAQQKRLREFAAYKELDIAGEYCDAGKSGKNIKGRPAFRQMMDDILAQKDEISYVVVFKLSRFGRNAADILKSLQLLSDFGVDLICVDDAIDSSTQGGRLTLAILSAVAEIERENISTQFMAGKMQKARDGKWFGGPVPYGYRNVDRELVQDPYEASIVRKIFDLYLKEDMMATSVAAHLNQNGILRRQVGGKEQEPLTYDFVSNVLDNPIYCGKLIYGRRTNKKDRNGKQIKPDPKNRLVSDGEHVPIITEDEWLQVQEKREKHSRWGRKVNEPERISLLSGLIKCPVCGAGMVARTIRHVNKNHGGYYKSRHYYICRNYRKGSGRSCSFSHTYKQEKIDDAVFEIISNMCGTTELREAISRNIRTQDMEDLQSKLQRKRKELRTAELELRRYGDRLDGLDVCASDYEKESERIQACMDSCYDRIAEAEEDIQVLYEQIETTGKETQSVENIEIILGHFKELYQKMTCQEKREMYRHFIDHIDVFPETGKTGKILKSISFRFSAEYGNVQVIPETRSEKMLQTLDNGEGEALKIPKRPISEKGIFFTLDCTNLDLTAAEAKVTYAELKKYILDVYGLKVSSLYIAQIKRKYGLEVGEQYRKPADPSKRVPVCPVAKEAAIIGALKHFKMMDPEVEYVIERETAANEG